MFGVGLVVLAKFFEESATVPLPVSAELFVECCYVIHIFTVESPEPNVVVLGKNLLPVLFLHCEPWLDVLRANVAWRFLKLALDCQLSLGSFDEFFCVGDLLLKLVAKGEVLFSEGESVSFSFFAHLSHRVEVDLGSFSLFVAGV